MKRRTKPIGPRSARTRAQTPKKSVHSHFASNPKSSSESAEAAVAITSSSNVVQPIPCTTLTPVGSSEPRWPSGARMSAIPGTRASAPIIAATASIAFPIEAADDDRDERRGQRQRRDEDRPRHDDEERDAEVPPEKPGLEPAQHPQARRHGLDPPAALDDLLGFAIRRDEAR